MASVYLFRHQHAGHVTTHVFRDAPTSEQLEAMRRRTNALHGEGWGIFVEVPLVEGEDIPVFEQVNVTDSTYTGAPDGTARVGLFQADGIGHVAP